MLTLELLSGKELLLDKKELEITLNDVFLRLDCVNDPLTNPLEIKVANATSILRLKRDDATISTDDVIGRIEIETTDPTDPGICAKIEAISYGSSGETGWRLSGGTPTSLTEFVRIDNLGYVGIGLTDPAEKLQVKGNVMIGDGESGVDYSLTFDGETNNGIVLWKEDEDYFEFQDDINLGGETNFIKISDVDGNITWGGSYKKKLAMRPAFNAGKLSGTGGPVSGILGAFSTYEFPIWDSGSNVNKELYWRLYVPGRWDGTTDIEYTLTVALNSAEDLNDDFAFQLSWANTTGTSGVISNAVVSSTVPQNINTGRTAQYSVYRLTFTIDVSAGPITAVAGGDVLVGRIRRVASGGTEVTGNILVLDHVLNFTVDKVFKTI